MLNTTSAAWPNVSTTEDTAGERPAYNWPVLCLFSIVVFTLGGNILVCLAVKFERKLQNMFNYFLVSLAISDMMSATLVMPLSIIKALIDNFPVPKLMCVTWYSLDVLFTSSTIIHLCMISIDRYRSLKYPLKYGHAKKRKHTLLRILAVWVISFCISGPLFIFSMYDKNSQVYYKGCGPETPTFVISATVTSFYLPLLIMTIMYILTVRALHHQRRAQRKMVIEPTSSSSIKEDSNYNLAKERSPKMERGNTVRKGMGSMRLSTGRRPLLGSDMFESQSMTRSLSPCDTEHFSVSDTFEQASRGGICSSPVSESALGDFTEQDSDGRNNRSFKKFRFTTRLRRNDTTSSSSSKKNGVERARRAVQVLGILFAVFVIFYLPFFMAYVINGTCMRCRHYITPEMIMAFEWLAYSGSLVNPIVYHIFNPDFRRAFHKLLRCKCTSL